MYVITHKPFDYQLPDGYQPLLVGADFNKNPRHYLTDNTGENISSLNKSFCELTGLYWMWKNAPDKGNIGLVHYRRYFGTHDFGGKKAALWHLKNIATHLVSPASIHFLDNYLSDADIILSHPDILDEGSIRGNYQKHHHIRDLNRTRQIINELSPSYLHAFDMVMDGDKLSLYNMFYTSREVMDKYCSWVFPILFKLNETTDISSYDSYQRRIFGFLGERLFNVWLAQNQQLKAKYLTVFNTQNMQKGQFVRYYKERLRYHLNKK